MVREMTRAAGGSGLPTRRPPSVARPSTPT